jgi:hypothetical protein
VVKPLCPSESSARLQDRDSLGVAVILSWNGYLLEA